MLGCLYLAKKVVVQLVCFILNMGKSHYPHVYPNTPLETFLDLVYFLQVCFCQTVIVSSEKAIDAV